MSLIGVNPALVSPAAKYDTVLVAIWSLLIYQTARCHSQPRFFCLAIRNQAIFGVAIGQWLTQRWPLDRLSSFLRNLHPPNPSRQPHTLRPVTRVLGLPHLAARIPQCRAAFFPEDGHFSLLIGRSDEILARLRRLDEPMHDLVFH